WMIRLAASRAWLPHRGAARCRSDFKTLLLEARAHVKYGCQLLGAKVNIGLTALVTLKFQFTSSRFESSRAFANYRRVSRLQPEVRLARARGSPTLSTRISLMLKISACQPDKARDSRVDSQLGAKAMMGRQAETERSGRCWPRMRNMPRCSICTDFMVAPEAS